MKNILDSVGGTDQQKIEMLSQAVMAQSRALKAVEQAMNAIAVIAHRDKQHQIENVLQALDNVIRETLGEAPVQH